MFCAQIILAKSKHDSKVITYSSVEGAEFHDNGVSSRVSR